MKISKLRKLAEAATPGPWCTEPGNFIAIPESRIVAEVPCTGGNDNDVPYIAACSPERILRLLAVVEAANKIRKILPINTRESFPIIVSDYDAACAALESD